MENNINEYVTLATLANAQELITRVVRNVAGDKIASADGVDLAADVSAKINQTLKARGV